MVGIERWLLMAVFFLSFFKLDASLITKAFYHRGRCVDKLVFYLDHAPQIVSQDRSQNITYLFSNTQLASPARQAMTSFLQLDLPYALSFSHHQDFKLQINFDFQPFSAVKAYQFKPISAPYGIAIKIEHEQDLSCSVSGFNPNPKEIVLDFGHGGHDSGARGGQIYEKDVVRKVGLKLAKLLSDKGYRVHLTRENDEFVPLDRRTYFANLYTNASLFVSLHANHANRSEVVGIETHCLDDALLKKLEPFSEFDELSFNSHNIRLAQIVHNHLLDAAAKYGATDRKVKKSVAQVLLGVEIPAILIELGFLSNPQEAQLLNSPDYQFQLAQGIYHGINSYMLAV